MTLSEPLQPHLDRVEDWLSSLNSPQVVCVFAPSDPNKGLWIRTLVERAQTHHRSSYILGADLGQNPWSAPACVSLSDIHGNLLFTECIGSLDPLRVQGRMISALARAIATCPQDDQTIVWVDAPGLVRGKAAADVLRLMCQTLRMTALIAVWDTQRLETLRTMLGPLSGLFTLWVETPSTWTRPSRATRREQRTQTFERFLEPSQPKIIHAGTARVLGTHWTREDWRGAVVGLLDGRGETCGVGVVDEAFTDPSVKSKDASSKIALQHTLHLRARALTSLDSIHAIITGDVVFDPDMGLSTRPQRSTPTPRVPPSWTTVERPALSVPISWPTARGNALYQPRMLNSLFGDPGLIVRHRTSGRSFVFDLGWLEEPLPGKILHGVTDIFISHGHMDHFQGMVSVLRSLMGPGGSVRIYGPPNIRDLVANLIGSFRFNLFDEDTCPSLLVHTLEGKTLRCARIHCTDSPTYHEVSQTPVPNGLILDEGDLQVHAIELLHSVPVLAFRASFPARPPAPDASYSVHKERYSLTYITDIGPSPNNLQRAVAFAKDTDVLVCESTFRQDDLPRALQTHHLTTHACAQLARDARAQTLVPFHFSPRYQDDPKAVYRELLSIFPNIVPAERMKLPYADPRAAP